MPTVYVKAGQQVATTQPVTLGGGAIIPVGAVATVLDPRTWQGNILVSIGEIQLNLAPSYFLSQPITLSV